MEKKKLSQKLYFMEGMSVDKISSLLDLRKSEVEDFIKQQDNFQIKNGQGNYEFRLLREGAGSKYSHGNYIEFFNSASGQWTAMHDFDKYFRINGLSDLPDMRVFLEYFFGTAKKVVTTKIVLFLTLNSSLKRWMNIRMKYFCFQSMMLKVG